MYSVYLDIFGQCILFMWTYSDNIFCLSGLMRTMPSVYLDVFGQFLLFIRTYADNVCELPGHMRTSSVYPDICGQYLLSIRTYADNAFSLSLLILAEVFSVSGHMSFVTGQLRTAGHAVCPVCPTKFEFKPTRRNMSITLGQSLFLVCVCVSMFPAMNCGH
jgi:hypothetical protein